MLLNRYSADCNKCGNRVPAKGGTLVKKGNRWIVEHLACNDSQSPEVIEIRFSSGASMIQNRNGRCEDAPCCGCCS